MTETASGGGTGRGAQACSGKAGLVSIITPARDAAPFIRETIATVKAQTYTAWEWLIADDGSADETVALIEEAAVADRRVRLFEVDPPHGLAARVRNLAMRHARGEYFAFLDVDDRWAPAKLERQVAYLEDHPEAQGVCCWWELFGDPAQVKRRQLVMKTAPVCLRSEFRESVPFQTSTVVVRRRCYDDHGGMDEDPRLAGTEDYEYFLRLVSASPIHRIREFLSFYRVAAASYTSQVQDTANQRGWKLFEVLQERGYLTAAEAARRKAFLYYEQAMGNLFFLDAPFRRCLVQAIATGRPPRKALGMFALSFLPASVLRPLLLRLEGIRKRLVHAGVKSPAP